MEGVVCIVRDVVFQGLTGELYCLPAGSRVACNLETHIAMLPEAHYVQLELDDYCQVLHRKGRWSLIEGGRNDGCCQESGRNESAKSS